MLENGSAASAGAVVTTLTAGRFFDLVDEVIRETGRDPFGETQRRIVEVRDDDAVLPILAGPGSGKNATSSVSALSRQPVGSPPALEPCSDSRPVSPGRSRDLHFAHGDPRSES